MSAPKTPLQNVDTWPILRFSAGCALLLSADKCYLSHLLGCAELTHTFTALPEHESWGVANFIPYDDLTADDCPFLDSSRQLWVQVNISMQASVQA